MLAWRLVCRGAHVCAHVRRRGVTAEWEEWRCPHGHAVAHTPVIKVHPRFLGLQPLGRVSRTSIA